MRKQILVSRSDRKSACFVVDDVTEKRRILMILTALEKRCSGIKTKAKDELVILDNDLGSKAKC